MLDRTLVAVKRQISTMKSGEYDVGIYHRDEDKMARRIWDINQILKSVSWLKSKNFSDHDIYIRPNGSVGLIFFDDLNISSLDSMKTDGIQPCVVIQSSPQNYQGWIRVSNDPIDKDLATRVCKIVAKQYGGDINSADWRHYGRLAGFTNRKKEYIDANGRYPFVLLSETSNALSKNNVHLLKTAKKSLKEERSNLFQTLKEIPRSKDGSVEIDKYYKDQIEFLRQRFGNEFDCSIADWWVVKNLVAQGVSKERAREVLINNSPALETRKNNHASKYLDVTLNKAYEI